MLQKEEVLDTSIKASKEQIQEVDQQTHLLRGVLQNKSLCLDKLRDHGLSRGTLPLSRAAPTGLSRCSRSQIDRTHYGAHHQPLRRRRPEKKKKTIRRRQQLTRVPSRTHLSLLQQGRRSVSKSSQTRRTAHLPPAPGHPTPFDLPKDLQTGFNCDQTRIQRQHQIRIQGKRNQMHT